MLTWCFDARDVLLRSIRNSNYISPRGFSFRSLRWLTGWGIKFFALFVVVKQEKGRIIRWVLNNRYKMDSGLETYNMFAGRSELIGDEQPHSVFFMDKFMQPTHLYLHSNPSDYPKTALERN